jgi:hypothetical protein
MAHSPGLLELQSASAIPLEVKNGPLMPTPEYGWVSGNKPGGRVESPMMPSQFAEGLLRLSVGS